MADPTTFGLPVPVAEAVDRRLGVQFLQFFAQVAKVVLGHQDVGLLALRGLQDAGLLLAQPFDFGPLGSPSRRRCRTVLRRSRSALTDRTRADPTQRRLSVIPRALCGTERVRIDGPRHLVTRVRDRHPARYRDACLPDDPER
ncbi:MULTISPECIES: hypothetical protein [unclassified Streptomyces]|uniref:hypothetical protein n=1 Tax=unclassified Streptomyces TaxID=2593676 RepID=UPI001F1F1A72|nr:MULTISPECIES: hypothetical protein [unclassified Streptomyces]WKX18052.1 hypothetical protein Q3Y68_08410 [Streptomyces sp. HUAS CX7]